MQQITFPEKVNEVNEHYAHGDTNLGFRRLIDCVLDTLHLPFYQRIVDLAILQEQEKTAEWLEKSQALIADLAAFPVVDKRKTEPLLHAKELVKRYGRGNFSVGPVDLAIYSGEIWGLVGENGNGKTTLLRALAKDLSVTSGNLNYDFFDPEGDLYDLRTQLTYIPQRTPKWYGSLYSNLQFAASHYGFFGERNELTVNMMIIRFGLWKYRNHQWSELSSGYKMRFELVRTFLRAPKLLLLDEPLANLDVLAQQMVLEDLKSLAQSCSNPIGIILSSQQLFEVEKVSDKVLFLRNGKPTFLSQLENEQLASTTVVELDTSNSRDEVNAALQHLSLVDVSFNGGVYIVELNGENQMTTVLDALVKAKLQVVYVRDISKSTRRLFVQ